jgi:DNA replication licensing factor MCM7
MQLQANQLYLPDYDAERTRCAEFITTFQDPRLKDPIHGKLKYMAQLQQVANRQAKVVQIEIDDVKEFFSAARDSHFCDRMRINTSRYIDLFA